MGEPRDVNDDNRCPTHHYMSGWCCQREPGHDGPCMANAGPNGTEWILSGGGRAIYAWHQPQGEPACNQTQCKNPNKCECAPVPPRTT